MSNPAAVVRGYLRDGDRNDAEALRGWLHDDVTVHSPGGVTTTGIPDNVATWAAAHAGLASLRHEIQELAIDRGLVAARVVVTGTHQGHFLGLAPTGRQIRVDQALFARVEGERIIEMWEVVDTGTALQQLGLIPDQALSPGEEPAVGERS